MGGIFSLNSSSECKRLDYEDTSTGSCKRQRVTRCFEHSTRLIPSLPNELSLQILARVPRAYYLQLKLVSRTWKEALSTSEIYDLRREFKITEEWLFILSRVEDNLSWYALDPVSQKWQRLPPMPRNLTHDESQRGLAIQVWNSLGSKLKIAEAVRGWLGGGDPLDKLPFCGCSIAAVNGCLYVVGGLSRTSALRCVRRYDPILNTWNEVSPMLTGRAYSKTGVINNKLYVVGGVSRYRGGLTPLQCAEVFDPETDQWSEVPSMPFAKAQVMPTAFLADLLKPIATGLTTYKNKLYVPQSLYCWPFFVDAGGEIYDPETNSWIEMPVGMGEGWPAKQAGTKLSVVVDDELYALDLSGSLDNAKIKVYDHQDDSWKVISGEVPMTHDQTDAESPYLLAGFLGKLHVIIKDANSDIAVLQAATGPLAQPAQLNSLSNRCSLIESSVASSPSEVIWKVIASRRTGPSELVSCQILRI
ncbi:F-box/kelch-repeat protein At1g22040-like [Chenopodium quinoa]|uniref:F-box/kelch-repeat protein At1g22040-like n=1 Tax=Chenopodium quinoa TaxID=63459 RepID=UPI000B773A9B|nr:F-box/kelch-repeat protein At1g22040-like [Chenopodium quinoa]